MSGHQFPDVESVTLEEWSEFGPRFIDVLTGVGARRIVPVGSTGKKPVMGDIDLAVYHPEGRDGLYERLEKRFELKRVGHDLVSVRCPLDRTRWVQIDLMVGDPTFLSWSRAGSTDPGVRGAARAIMLNAMLRNLSPAATGLTRTRHVLDFGSGLYRVRQTRHGKKNNTLKEWKTLSRKLVTSDPDQIIKFLFGMSTQATVESTKTVSGLVAAARASNKWTYFIDTFLIEYLGEIKALDKKKPGTYGDLKAISQIALQMP